MQITKMEITKTTSFQEYSPVKFGLTVQLDSGDDPTAVFKQTLEVVERKLRVIGGVDTDEEKKPAGTEDLKKVTKVAVKKTAAKKTVKKVVKKSTGVLTGKDHDDAANDVAMKIYTAATPEEQGLPEDAFGEMCWKIYNEFSGLAADNDTFTVKGVNAFLSDYVREEK